MKQQRKIEALVLALAFVIALAQPHVNGLTFLACAMAAAVVAAEYRYTWTVRAQQTQPETEAVAVHS